MNRLKRILGVADGGGRLLIVHRDLAASATYSYTGLQVSSAQVVRVLRREGLEALAVSVAGKSADGWENQIAAAIGDHQSTHIAFAAPFLPTVNLGRLARRFPDVGFAVVCHSNVGFLVAEPPAIKLLREVQALSMGTHNVVVAANCDALATYLRGAYQGVVLSLPNLYDLSTATTTVQRWAPGSLLRVGCFGAIRVLKNHATAAAAALLLKREFGVDLEFWCNKGRVEGGSLDAVRALLRDVAGVSLREAAWADWSGFRDAVRTMHLVLMPSFTESFSVVTADALAAGVPVVVGPSIEWLGDQFTAEADDASHIAAKCRAVLMDPRSVPDARQRLVDYNAAGVLKWRQFLAGTNCGLGAAA